MKRKTWLTALLGALLGVATSAQAAPATPGIAPEQQRRMDVMKSKGVDGSLTIVPIRVSGRPWNRVTEVAGLLLEKRGLKNIELAKTPFEPADANIMADLSAAVGAVVRTNPAATDHALYADYGFNPQNAEQGFVHFVVCDRKGEWVIVDLQNSHHTDYQSVGVDSRARCDHLLVKWLQGYLK